MSGQGVYVWSAFFLCLICVVIEGLSLTFFKKKTQQRLRRIRQLSAKKANHL
nr:heme exporter protein CcmD [Brackiella oedipodis]